MPIFPILLTGLIVALTLIPLIFIFVGVIGWLRRKKVAVKERWEQEGRIFRRGPSSANFSGVESRGMGQIRGNGFIALTDQDFRVTRAIPAGEWRIALEQINDVELKASFLGLRRAMRVLVVVFEQDGLQDRIGVYVSDSDGWLQAIVEAAGLDNPAR